MVNVELIHSRTATSFALLRPLSGLDECAIRGSGLGAAVSLVARLLVPAAGALQPDGVVSLAVADFDRILLGLQRSLYGDTLECKATCTACAGAFEFTVLLGSLAQAPTGFAPVARVPDLPGVFHSAHGVTFRLPTVLEALRGLSADALRAACAEGQSAFASASHADEAFAMAGPLASDTLVATCVHCRDEQSIGLDLVDYTMQMLSRERPFLIHEIHRIARAYGWSLQDIQSLTREDRRSFVRLIGHESRGMTRVRRSAA